ncbi:MAG: flagellar hook-length control protein FliK [Gemmobacter sp.]
MIEAIFQRSGAGTGVAPIMPGAPGDGGFLRELARQTAPGPEEGAGDESPADKAGAVPGDGAGPPAEAAPDGAPNLVPGGHALAAPPGDSGDDAGAVHEGGRPRGAPDADRTTRPGLETAGARAEPDATGGGASPSPLRPEGQAAPPAAMAEGAPPVDADPAPAALPPPVGAAAVPPRFAPVPSPPQPPPLPLRVIADAALTATGRTLELRLWPEELGVLRMTLTPEGDSIRVAILADRAETFDLLRRHGADLVAEFRALGFGGVRFSFGHGGGQEGRGRPDDNGAGPEPVEGVPVPGATMGPVTVAGLDLRI